MSQAHPAGTPGAPDPAPESLHAGRRGVLWVSKAVAAAVYLYVLAIEIILTLGFVLLLLGANPSSPFVEWLYRSVDRVMRPFRGIFEPVELGITGNEVPSVFEPSVLFAMIIYALVALAVSAALDWLTARRMRLDRLDEIRRHEQLLLQAADRARRAPPAESGPDADSPPPADRT